MTNKKCEATCVSTGKKCKKRPISDSVYCYVHVKMSIKIPTKTEIYVSSGEEEQGIYIPADLWNCIFDALEIEDIRRFMITCAGIYNLSKKYWNSLETNADKKRYYSIFKTPTYGNDDYLCKGDTETIFFYTGTWSLNYGDEEFFPMICESDDFKNFYLIGSYEDCAPLSKKCQTATRLFSKIDNYDSFIKYCKKMSGYAYKSIDNREEINLLELRGGIIEAYNEEEIDYVSGPIKLHIGQYEPPCHAGFPSDILKNYRDKIRNFLFDMFVKRRVHSLLNEKIYLDLNLNWGSNTDIIEEGANRNITLLKLFRDRVRQDYEGYEEFNIGLLDRGSFMFLKKKLEYL